VDASAPEEKPARRRPVTGASSPLPPSPPLWWREVVVRRLAPRRRSICQFKPQTGRAQMPKVSSPRSKIHLEWRPSPSTFLCRTSSFGSSQQVKANLDCAF